MEERCMDMLKLKFNTSTILQRLLNMDDCHTYTASDMISCNNILSGKYSHYKIYTQRIDFTQIKNYAVFLKFIMLNYDNLCIPFKVKSTEFHALIDFCIRDIPYTVVNTTSLYVENRILSNEGNTKVVIEVVKKDSNITQAILTCKSEIPGGSIIYEYRLIDGREVIYARIIRYVFPFLKLANFSSGVYTIGLYDDLIKITYDRRKATIVSVESEMMLPIGGCETLSGLMPVGKLIAEIEKPNTLYDLLLSLNSCKLFHLRGGVFLSTNIVLDECYKSVAF